MRGFGVLVVVLILGLFSACDQIEALKEKFFPSRVSSEQEPPELKQARELLESGEVERAIQQLEQFTGANPMSAQGYYYLGLCYLQMAGGDFDPSAPLSEWEQKSRDAFEMALTLNPRHARAARSLGDLYERHVTSRRQRRVDAENPRELALEAYRNAVTIDPNLPDSQLHYARLLERVGQLQEAEQAYKAAAEAAATIPENAPDCYMEYGRFLAERRGRWEDAIHQYELARMFRRGDLEIERGIAVAHARMGQHYFDNEQYSLAEQELSLAVDMFPDKSDPEAQEAASTLERLRSLRRR